LGLEESSLFGIIWVDDLDFLDLFLFDNLLWGLLLNIENDPCLLTKLDSLSVLESEE